MGPKAGAALYDSIVSFTQARTDQEHLSTILMSFPEHIVDRTLFLEGMESVNPAVNIVKIISKLEAAGAEIVGMACNTSYSPRIFNIILEELAKMNSHVKMLHMPLETCNYIKETVPGARRIGLLTTNGTYRSGIYSHQLRDMGYEVVVPDDDFQNDVVHKMIYDPVFGIKSDPRHINRKVSALMKKALQYFREKKADVIVQGCTELSLLIAGKMKPGVPIVDSTESFAKALIREATGCKQYFTNH